MNWLGMRLTRVYIVLAKYMQSEGMSPVHISIEEHGIADTEID
jgi:hypothetical protein